MIKISKTPPRTRMLQHSSTKFTKLQIKLAKLKQNILEKANNLKVDTINLIEFATKEKIIKRK